MKELFKYPLLLLFSAFLLVGSAVDILTPPKKESEMENRPLAQQPELTWNTLTAVQDEQKYSIKYEKYINDQFIGRDAWITLKSISESALGKLENNGIVYGKNGHLFEKYTATDDWRIAKNVDFLSAFIEQYSNKTPVTFALIPSSYAIYSEWVPGRLQNVDQKAYIPRIYEMLPKQTVTFDAFSPLEQAKAGEIYYRTDHHWTTAGAYQLYRALMESKGRPAVLLEQLAPYQQQVEGFLGTFYSKSKLFSAKPETIDRYDLPVQSVVIDGEQKDSLYDASKWETRDKYAAFLWGNNGLTVIRSENNLAKQPGETSRVLLVKDSYGNCLAPFLTYSYDEVYVVDLRSIAKMSEIMQDTAFTDILVMYSFMNFASDTNLARLTY